MGEVVKQFLESIVRLEEFTAELEGATDGQELTKHHFAPGVYLREFFLPKGMYFTSKIHKTTHFLIVASGKTKIVSEKGEQIIVGPTVLLTTPGTKRAVYGIEDTTFFTVHVSEETDLEKLEDNLIAKSFDDTDLIEATKKIGELT
jgi:quercetin dioxygenase-like cupin family protein